MALLLSARVAYAPLMCMQLNCNRTPLKEAQRDMARA